MEFVPLLAMAALVIAGINFFKFLMNKRWNEALTQLVVWLVGVFVIALVAHTDYASGIDVGGMPLDMLNGWSLVFVGLQASSVGTTINELKKAFDQRDSAAKPPMFKGLDKTST